VSATLLTLHAPGFAWRWRGVSVGLPVSAYTNRELGAAPACQAGRFLNYSKSTKVQSFADAITGTKGA